MNSNFLNVYFDFFCGQCVSFNSRYSNTQSFFDAGVAQPLPFIANELTMNAKMLYILNVLSMKSPTLSQVANNFLLRSG